MVLESVAARTTGKPSSTTSGYGIANTVGTETVGDDGSTNSVHRPDTSPLRRSSYTSLAGEYSASP